MRRNVLEYHWDLRSRVDADDWRLNLGIYKNGRIVGVQSMSAKGFLVLGSVTTGSWVAAGLHGHGIGSLARLLVLHLGFEGLAAQEMVCEAYTDNPASNAVSAKLGYRLADERRVARDGSPVIMRRWSMTREAWDGRPDHLRAGIRSHGLDPVIKYLGISS
ncbi:GNAT family N-acetyltransferase [Antribacter sp. KLBMP9083]|uniref:GNAT family N-acetyltransferase n=1 Tax=Antribacter soli TaxID=2910976 RepID=A0AA41QF71_9MICO|nr:GNAT family protein [Antribacter soli]MCF4122021.1 GNAT family N-acetyltransferase [Antribacter soli]